MKIAPNAVVTMHYTVSSADGVQIDSSKDGEPMRFIHGHNFLIQGLEDALEDKAVGDNFEVQVAPELAYGERHEELVQVVPKSMFEGMDVDVGMQFRATTDDGEQSVVVIDVNDDGVVIDGNHPLSGVTLSFDVEVLEVREATEEELAHGHVHGDQGCDHSH
ncbi:FKBP-type peptidyl-prolyl cis-trans isomerase [Lacimicrobium alkaliphilum]|uniref:Peptidyl-prolyl cis-trans isomerase n=1 Tax=Lacimicrobium alkaliphilum TaxID=1526571 RepID=A0ABQ1RJW2_9ALTE|nr:peptidylprolyl isomerase [Lacimicrobium alkaliphilum]GGD69133.1 peptidyl-prolyl cis-trans isomerase [Lacimicrobium alkaliphilum]